VELILPLFSEPQQRPVFLEVGGYDGIHESNTLFLQRCLGWSGLMIEASPQKFDELVANRPGVAALHSALSERCEPNSSIRFGGTGTSSAILSDRRSRSGIEVPCAPLRHLLDALNVPHISFMSVDVEGAEAEVVRSIDWSRQSVAVMVVEENTKSHAAKNAQVAAFLRKSTPMRWMFRACWTPKGDALCDAYWVDPRFVDVPRLLAANATYDHHAIRSERAGAVFTHTHNARCRVRDVHGARDKIIA